jgi:hypothetical protein
MKFNTYLLETTGPYAYAIDAAVDQIEKDCASYLNALQDASIKKPFCRGTNVSDYNNLVPPILYSKLTREDRRPRAMPRKDFDELNKWLEENGHLRRDNTVIATSKEDIGLFGRPCWFFPVGKFNYTFVKSKDINYSDAYASNACRDIIKNWPVYPLTKEENKILNSNIITNKDIHTAYRKNYEIWFACKEYYLVPMYTQVEVKGSRVTVGIKVWVNPLKIVVNPLKIVMESPESMLKKLRP